MNKLESEIRDHLYGVLDGQTALDDFEAWFIGRTWDEPSALASDIDAALVERAMLDEGELLVALKDIVARYRDAGDRADDRSGLGSDGRHLRLIEFGRDVRGTTLFRQRDH